MQTKLSKLCGGIIEASWLGALLIIPIFFNVYSSRIFEPDKASLLRILVLLGVAAWVLKNVDELASNQERKNNYERIKIFAITQIHRPIILAAFSLILVYFLATLLSITPATSFWGSYQRSQGLYTILSYVILFFIVAGNVKSKLQVERIITFTILTSVPVSLYGIIQHYGLDPIPWAGNVTTRISANMGNSIFIAAYLVMIVPITVIRVVSSLGFLLKETSKFFSYLLISAFYILILCIQLAAIFFSGSRGPWIGLAVSLVVVWFGLAFIWRKPALYISGLVILSTSVIFLFVLNIKSGPLEPIRNMPGIGRLGQLLDSESRTGKVRSLIWQGASQLVLPHEPLNYPDGSEDRLNVIRPLIGYGPESMFVAFNRFYPPELTEVEKRNAAPDRSHNEIWDSLIFSGLIGMTVTLLLFGAIILSCLKKIGFIFDRKQLITFYTCSIGGGVTITTILLIWKGSGYFGVGMPLGLVLGVILFMILSTPQWKNVRSMTQPEYQRTLLFLGLMAAVLAHSTELIFGFGITATRMYFWIFAGLLLALGDNLAIIGNVDAHETTIKLEEQSRQTHLRSNSRDKQTRPNERSASGKRKKQQSATKKNQTDLLGAAWVREGFLSGLLLALILATIGFDYISIDSGNQNIVSIIKASFFQGGSTDGNNSLALLFISSWIIIGLVLMLEVVNSQIDAKPPYLTLNIFALSITVAFVFIAWHAGALSGIVRTLSSEYTQILKQVFGYENTFTTYVIFSVSLLIVYGWLSVVKWPQKFASLPAKILSPIIIVLTIVAMVFLNMRAIRADIVFKAADSYIRAGSWPTAIKLYSKSIELAPKEDYYFLFLAKAYFEYSKSLPDEASRIELLGKAEKDMLRAQGLNPLNTDHTANLARLYSTWSELIDDPAEQTAKAQQASDYYAQAVNLSPNNSRLLGEWAFSLFSQLEQHDEAYRIIKRALTIDPKYDWLHGLLGEYYFNLAESLPGDSQEKKEFYIQALDSYQKNFDFSSVSDVVSRYRVMLSIARVLSRLGDSHQSIIAYQKALDLYPASSDKWRIHEVIARLFVQIGDKENALQNARQSLEFAPDEYKKQIELFIDEIENKP
jgi:tetratricopeptide (TPR) repeat protein